MDRRISATVDASSESTMQALADLATYPNWLSLVAGAESVDAADGDTGPAWMVTLKARLGPLARSKRLRMVRTALDPVHVRFERAEIDGRDHAEWVLEATVTPDVSADRDRCDVLVHLHYGGALWSTPLEVALAAFEGSAADRLAAYLSDA